MRSVQTRLVPMIQRETSHPLELRGAVLGLDRLLGQFGGRGELEMQEGPTGLDVRPVVPRVSREGWTPAPET